MIHEGRQWETLSRAEKHEAVRARELTMSATMIAKEFQVTKGVISGIHNQLIKEAGRKPAGKLPPSGRSAPVLHAKPAAPKPPKKRKAGAVLVGGMAVPKAASGLRPISTDFKGRAEQRAASPGIAAKHAAAFKPISPTAIVEAKAAPAVAKIEPCTLMELRHNCCKWPVGGDGADMLFCSRPVAGELAIYCTSHERQAHVASRGPAPSAMRSAPRLRHQT